jgi:lysophospholipase L1-like esterase
LLKATKTATKDLSRTSNADTFRLQADRSRKEAFMDTKTGNRENMNPIITRTEDVSSSSFRRHWSLLWAAALVAVFAATVMRPRDSFAEDGNAHWVGTWSTALQAPDTIVFGSNPGFNNQTLRQIVHTSVGGNRVRVRLSTFGTGSLVVGGAHVALRDTGASIVPESDRTLTFGGQPSITIPAGAIVFSDPVDLDVPALVDLAVSIFVPGSTGPATWHFEALQTSYVSPPGDFTASAVMPVDRTTHYRAPNGTEHDAWFWLGGVEVMAIKQSGAIVVFGDSVTDGTQSTPDTNSRWPDQLARRMMAQPGNHEMGVLNGGIAGNKLLHDIIGPNALARFDRDVLTQAGVTHAVVLMGNNDILFVFSPADVVTVEQIIEGHRQLIQRAHARGLKIYGGTLTPFEGFFFSSPAKEAMRQAVNGWIRTSGEYDAVLDFDAVLRDPTVPTRLRSLYDSGDHLHPSDLGYAAMANAIDLKLFKNGEEH